MKKLLLASICSIPVGVIAQPTFTAADLTPEIGPTPTVHSTDYVPAGPATAGFTFDVSSSVAGPGVQSQYLAASSTPYASYFPQATMASTGLTNQDTYNYWSMNSTEFLNWGYYGTTSQVIYTNAEKMYQFPMTYGSSWTDSFSGTATTSGITMTRTGTTEVDYNGYGTVIMPFGTFNNVARLQISQTYNDEYMGFITTSQVNNVAYITHAQPNAVSLFTTSEILMDLGGGLEPFSEMSSIIEPGAVGILETGEKQITAILMPNPAQNIVSILLTDPASGLEAQIFDATGRTVRTIAGESMQNARITFNVSEMHSGAYYVRLHDANGATCTLPLIVE